MSRYIKKQLEQLKNTCERLEEEQKILKFRLDNPSGVQIYYTYSPFNNIMLNIHYMHECYDVYNGTSYNKLHEVHMAIPKECEYKKNERLHIILNDKSSIIFTYDYTDYRLSPNGEKNLMTYCISKQDETIIDITSAIKHKEV